MLRSLELHLGGSFGKLHQSPVALTSQKASTFLGPFLRRSSLLQLSECSMLRGSRRAKQLQRKLLARRASTNSHDPEVNMSNRLISAKRAAPRNPKCWTSCLASMLCQKPHAHREVPRVRSPQLTCSFTEDATAVFQESFHLLPCKLPFPAGRPRKAAAAAARWSPTEPASRKAQGTRTKKKLCFGSIWLRCSRN